MKTVQKIVPPETMTLKPLGKGVHYGNVSCPLCQQVTLIAGPKSGMGVAYIYDTCEHSQGIALGANWDITVLFRV